jgi:hypothetical protein
VHVTEIVPGFFDGGIVRKGNEGQVDGNAQGGVHRRDESVVLKTPRPVGRGSTGREGHHSLFAIGVVATGQQAKWKSSPRVNAAEDQRPAVVSGGLIWAVRFSRCIGVTVE